MLSFNSFTLFHTWAMCPTIVRCSALEAVCFGGIELARCQIYVQCVVAIPLMSLSMPLTNSATPFPSHDVAWHACISDSSALAGPPLIPSLCSTLLAASAVTPRSSLFNSLNRWPVGLILTSLYNVLK
jgi:hypothetical protein